MNNINIEIKQMKARKVGSILAGLAGAFFIFCGIVALVFVGEASDYSGFLGIIMFVIGGGFISMGLVVIGFFNEKFVYATEYLKQHKPQGQDAINHTSKTPNISRVDNNIQPRPVQNNVGQRNVNQRK